MPKENCRLVVLSDKVVQVFEGDICIAEFEITGEVTKEDIEAVRLDNYKVAE